MSGPTLPPDKAELREECPDKQGKQLRQQVIMNFAPRIFVFNLWHIAVLLFANLLWALVRAFVIGEIDHDIEKLDTVTQVISLFILSIVGAWSLGLYVILLAIFLIQLVSFGSLIVLRYLVGSNFDAFRLSVVITTLLLLPYFAIICFETFNTPLLFWFSYPLFVLLEWVKYSRFVVVAKKLDGIQA